MIQTILLAEDNLEQCFFFEKAVKDVAPNTQLVTVNDGEKLIELIGLFLPDILFLDLSMPCKDGVQCIKEIRENRLYDSLPIVVFTINSQNNVIQTTYAFGANLYFVKPNTYLELAESLKQILSMDWSEPKQVTEKYFNKNRYKPFSPVY